jgi:hypothetical protein
MLARHVYSWSAMKFALPAVLLALAIAGTAAAQPAMTPPSTSPLPPSAWPPPTMQPGEALSESTAVWLSLGGTVASWGLIAVASQMDERLGGNAGNIASIGALGTLLAPSFGHWYAGSYFTRGLGMRLAGVGATYLGLGILLSGCEEDCSNAGLAAALLLGGAGFYLAGTIDDIATASGKVRRHNERLQNVAIVPMIRSDSGGLALAGRF